MTDWARDHLTTLLTPLARLLDRAGISPNAITVSGLLLSICAGIVLALGYRLAGAALIVAAGLMDGMDEKLQPEDWELLDHLAAITISGQEDFAEIRRLYAEEPRLQVPEVWPA